MFPSTFSLVDLFLSENRAHRTDRLYLEEKACISVLLKSCEEQKVP